MVPATRVLAFTSAVVGVTFLTNRLWDGPDTTGGDLNRYERAPGYSPPRRSWFDDAHDATPHAAAVPPRQPPPVSLDLCAELVDEYMAPEQAPLPCRAAPRRARRTRRPRRRVLRTWERA